MIGWLLENVGYRETSKRRFCVFECPSEEEKKKRQKRTEKQQQKQQPEPIFTTAHREKMYSLFKIIIRMNGAPKKINIIITPSSIS